MTIGSLAEATQTRVETVRWYEKVGLLPPPARSSGNYRLYGPEHLRRLSFIRRGRALGFTVEQIRDPKGRRGQLARDKKTVLREANSG
ncbi:hypothetical protein CHKEEEPN_0178 [Methylorubrum podarium]|nr:hypothetical protein CHKEEEPN_0178 [Methylorubrum podarium]